MLNSTSNLQRQHKQHLNILLLLFKTAEEVLEEATAEVEKLAGQNDALQRSTQNADDAVSTAQSQLNKAQAAVKETEAAIKQTNQELKTAQSAWTAAGKALEDFSKKAEKVGKSATQIGKSLTTTVTTPILGLATGAVKASVEFESAFAGVRKTVDASEAEFDELAGSIKQMSTEVAASTTDIASVVETAGQLGIENSHLMEFARTMIDLGNSTNMQADEAASQAARFANIMGMSQSQFQNLGSTLVDLGNNYATTESEIMAMSLRLAGAGKQVGLSEAEILGFAAALSSVGIEAQMGGSAFSKALVKMEVAAATGGEALDDFAKVSGMTSAQFKNIWENDPAAAFQAFITGLSRMDEQVLMSNYMPLIGAGNKVILYGDYSYYWLAEREGRTMERLNELYAVTDQVGFKMTERLDGRLILPEAVKVLQMKA